MSIEGDLNVSRETLDKLKGFADLVEKWTSKINLISKSSIAHIWERHILDSAQIFGLAPTTGRWVDIGSGGGFPGIVAAILTEECETPHQMYLIESDIRKCAFLRSAIRELELNASVINGRIEAQAPMQADIISARALASLTDLLGFANRHLNTSGTALFLKGESWEKEHEEAQKAWSYRCEVIKSETHSAAAILKVEGIARV